MSGIHGEMGAVQRELDEAKVSQEKLAKGKKDVSRHSLNARYSRICHVPPFLHSSDSCMWSLLSIKLTNRENEGIFSLPLCPLSVVSSRSLQIYRSQKASAERQRICCQQFFPELRTRRNG